MPNDRDRVVFGFRRRRSVVVRNVANVLTDRLLYTRQWHNNLQVSEMSRFNSRLWGPELQGSKDQSLKHKGLGVRVRFWAGAACFLFASYGVW